jgi:serine/threonine-protein kinase
MAPEQWVGQAVPQTDVYALGIVLYQMITGRLPHEADTPAAMLIKHVNEPLVHPKELVPDLPDQVETVVLKALAKKPEARASMDDLAADLERLAGGEAALYQRRPTPILDRLYDRLTSEPKEAGSGTGTASAVRAEAATVVRAPVSEAPPTILAGFDKKTELVKTTLQPSDETVLSRPATPVPPPQPSRRFPRWVWVVVVLGFLVVEALIVMGVYVLARAVH